MQAPPRVTDALHQLALYETVDVLVRPVHPGRVAAALLEDGREAVRDGLLVGRVQHARARQRLRPREAARHIVFEEAAIEWERDAEVERGGIGGGIKAAGP